GADDPCVVEHHIETAESFDGGVDEMADIALFRHIAVFEVGGIAERRRHLLPAVALDVRDHDVRALAHEEPSGRLAQTAGATGDHRHLACYSSRHRLRPLTYVPKGFSCLTSTCSPFVLRTCGPSTRTR